MAKAIPHSEAVRSPKHCRPAHARGAIFPAAAALRGEHALRLGRMGRDEIHERRRQAVVGLQLQLLQPCTDLTHASRWESRLDDRGDERGEAWGLPAALLRQLDMEEVEAEEGVSLVLDASEIALAAWVAMRSMSAGDRQS